MKIAIAVYVAVTPQWGGAYSYALNILEALARFPRDKFTVEVWYAENCWEGVLKRYPHIKRHALRKNIQGLFHRITGKIARGLGFRHTFDMRSIAARGVNRLNPALCICPQEDSLDINGRLRQLAAVHDCMHIYEPAFPEVGAPDIVAGRNKKYSEMARNCTAILVDSPVGARHMVDHFAMDAHRLKILPYTVSRAILAVQPRKPARAPLPARFFFYPAQFWEHKNHTALVDAMALLRSRCPDVHCVFAGTTDKSGYDKTLDRIHSLHMADHVTILDFVSLGEMSWLYRNARALLMPTFFGPTNIPPLEAMSFGCPVAASGIYGMPEQCGDAALYFDPRSPRGIAETMARLWTDDALRRELVRKGYERMRLLGHAAFEERLLSIVCSLVNPLHKECV